MKGRIQLIEVPVDSVLGLEGDLVSFLFSHVQLSPFSSCHLGYVLHLGKLRVLHSQRKVEGLQTYQGGVQGSGTNATQQQTFHENKLLVAMVMVAMVMISWLPYTSAVAQI